MPFELFIYHLTYLLFWTCFWWHIISFSRPEHTTEFGKINTAGYMSAVFRVSW